jgi:hypothetical protein
LKESQQIFIFFEYKVTENIMDPILLRSFSLYFCKASFSVSRRIRRDFSHGISASNVCHFFCVKSVKMFQIQMKDDVAIAKSLSFLLETP